MAISKWCFTRCRLLICSTLTLKNNSLPNYCTMGIHSVTIRTSRWEIMLRNPKILKWCMQNKQSKTWENLWEARIRRELRLRKACCSHLKMIPNNCNLHLLSCKKQQRLTLLIKERSQWSEISRSLSSNRTNSLQWIIGRWTSMSLSTRTICSKNTAI